MTKPKVGEIWECSSGYSWGQCLVLVTKIEPWTGGEVIDGENLTYDSEREAITPPWCFLPRQFIRRIQEAE